MISLDFDHKDKIIHKITYDTLLSQKYKLILFCIVVCLTSPLMVIIASYGVGTYIELLTKKQHKQAQIFLIKLLILTVLSKMMMYVKERIQLSLVNQFYYEFRYKIYEVITELLKKNYSQPRITEVSSYVSNLPSCVYSILMATIESCIPGTFLFIGVLISSYIIHPYAFLFFLGISTLMALNTLLSYKKTNDAFLIAEKEYFKLLNQLENIIVNLFEILSTNNIQQENKTMKEMEKHLKHIYYVKIRNVIDNKGIFSLIQLVSISGLILLIRFLYLKKNISPILLTTLIYLHTKVIDNVDLIYWTLKDGLEEKSYLKLACQYFSDLSVSERPFKMMDIERSKQFPTAFKGYIEFRNVSFCYPSKSHNAIQGVTFSMKPKEKIIIRGKSGSGKSTIGKLLMGFYYPENEQIFIDNRDINTLHLEYIRKYIGAINQMNILFDNNVEYNILYGTKHKTRKDIMNILQQFQITSLDTLENGLDTMVGVGGSTLSGGQRQTILLLRILLRDTPMVIMDEPTSALDDASFEAIEKIIVQSNKSILLITHDNRFNDLHFDQALVMDNGTFEKKTRSFL